MPLASVELATKLAASMRMTLVSIALLVPACIAAAQCQPQWLRGLGTPNPSASNYALTRWDPDGSGPLPTCIAAAGGSSLSYWHDGGWRSLNVGTTPPGIWALGTYNGDLVAGGGSGAWTGAGSGLLLARWTGTQWAPIGTQSPSGNTVECFVEHEGNLYAGGRFTSAGGQQAFGLARFDGSVWTPLPQSPPLEIYALTEFEGQIVAGGGLNSGTPRVAVWNGQSWAPFPVQPPSIVIEGLAVLDGQLIAGGTESDGQVVYRWNGSTWESITANLTGAVGELIVHEGAIVSIGAHMFKVMRRDSASAQWGPLGEGLTSTVRAFADAGSFTYIAGSFWAGSAQPLQKVARFDGRSFSPLGSTDTLLFGSVEALAIHNGDLIAGGSFTTLLPRAIIRWDGDEWIGLGDGLDRAVHAIAVYGGEIIAGGDFDFAVGSTTPTRGVARWDGAQWRALAGGLEGSSIDVFALAVQGADLYVGGQFARAEGQNAANIARWDGTQWHAMGAGTNNTVRALAVHHGQLYAGGEFTVAGGVPAAYVARWDGAQWHGLGAPGPTAVRDLRSHNGRLVAAGTFVPPSGPPARYVFAWDGAQWSALGSGPDFIPERLGSFAGDLLIGGNFHSVDGLPWSYLARYGCSCYANCDNSATAPMLNVADFTCFLQQFAAGQLYANCDDSTIAPVLNVADFTCFLQRFAAGCP
jgi:hypothetical protein